MKIGLPGRFFVWCLVGLLVAMNGPATAAEANDAESLINRGLELRQAGQDRQALPLFQEAAKKSKTPRSIAQVGLCEYALGLWVDAETHIQQALTSRTDAWIRKNERSLKTSLDGIQEKLGLLDLWGEPAGALVAVDGHEAGKLPFEHPLRLPSGRHGLLIQAPGFVEDTRFVEVPVRTLAREHVALAPKPVLTPPPPSAQSTALLTGKTAAPVAGTESDPESSSAPIYTRWWFWTAIGVVAVAAGATVFVLSKKDRCDSSGGSSCVAW